MERKVKFLTAIISILGAICLISLVYNFQKEGCAKNIEQPATDQTSTTTLIARAITTSPKTFKTEDTKAEDETVSPSDIEEITATESNSSETEIIEDYTDEIKVNDTIADYNSSDI